VETVIHDETPDRLGSLTDAVQAALAELAERNAVARTWARDHTLWREDPTEISDRLGWLTVVPDMVTRLDELRATCADILEAEPGGDALGPERPGAGGAKSGNHDVEARAARSAAAGAGSTSDVDHVLLAGMGGSSLFPEVVARSTASGGGAPALHVLDTTDPAAIARVGRELAPERTLVIAASKSGTTLETRSHLAWAWDRHPDPARFAVITDPGSELAALAAERGFAATFENPPDIGGRYSALSLFGLVPAILAGADVDGLLASASGITEALRTPPPANPAARLAATMAAAVRAGRDKLTLVVPEHLATFGLWLEQLLAESTGKDGTGIVPVVGEPVGDPPVYGEDRLFVAVGEPGPAAGPLDALADAGHPVIRLGRAGSFADLGEQVLLWELATALAGALLGIHPFDQPDVAAAKVATSRVLAEGRPDLPLTPLAELLDQVGGGDYLAIQVFVDPGPSGRGSGQHVSAAVAGIESARVALRDRLGVATTLGLGPRFLHSTGQLHKGGPNRGVFVQVLGDADVDVPIPGEDYGFAALEQAQADGDLLTLHERKRRAGRVRLDELLEVS
jgi:glucose-6-phosphate isomerase